LDRTYRGNLRYAVVDHGNLSISSVVFGDVDISYVQYGCDDIEDVVLVLLGDVDRLHSLQDLLVLFGILLGERVILYLECGRVSVNT
jgi:hypothetical protein